MTILRLGEEEIVLDNKVLEFTDVTVNNFLQTYGANYAYYADRHAKSQYILGRYEDAAEALESKKFREFKEIGGSDKLCEAKAKEDAEVQEAQERTRVSRHAVNSLWGFLKALSFAHQSALNLCWNLRKEMEGLNSTVKRLESHYD